jgi:Family of unknown function (DUF5519)
MEQVKIFTETVSTWPQISVHPHRFGGREFRLGSAEVGHIHTGGVVDIPFPRAVRDLLVAQGLASEHHWVPDSGWVTFRIRNEHDLKHALWLMRLSYVRYTLKMAADPHKFLQQENQQLQLSSALASLIENLLPR